MNCTSDATPYLLSKPGYSVRDTHQYNPLLQTYTALSIPDRITLLPAELALTTGVPVYSSDLKKKKERNIAAKRGFTQRALRVEPVSEERLSDTKNVTVMSENATVTTLQDQKTQSNGSNALDQR